MRILNSLVEHKAKKVKKNVSLQTTASLSFSPLNTSCSSVISSLLTHYANVMYFILTAVFGRPVGGGNLRDSDAQQRQQCSQADHRQADSPLRLQERPDRRHHQGEAGLRRW